MTFSCLLITILFSLFTSSCESSDDSHLKQSIKPSTIPNSLKLLKEEDVLSNQEKKYSFGEDKYECFGSCYCDENNEKNNREASSNIIISSKRSFSYLLISLSTMIAYSKAKSYFDSKCNEELSKECHYLSSIKSSVEECSLLVVKKQEKKKEEEEEEEIEITEKDYYEKRRGEERRIYFCYGNCLYHKHKKESNSKYFKHLKCEKLKKEGEVIVYENDLLQTSNTPSRNFRITAQSKFVEKNLVGYCRENSIVEFTNIWEGIIGKGKYKVKKRKEIKSKGVGCVGRKRGTMKNVRCRQVLPKPTNTNWKWSRKRFNQRKEEWDLI